MNVIGRRFRGLLAPTCLPVAIACGQTPSTTPKVSPTPLPPVPVISGSVVTGVMFENTGWERQPVPGARVVVVDLIEGPYGDYPWHETTTDATGRFSVT